MPMKASTITGTTYTLKQGNTAIAGIVSYMEQQRIYSYISIGCTVYTATVSAAVTNLDNTRLPSEYVWKFTTGTIVLQQ
jgi:hypothetical protein